ncbi:glutamyl aminopeptidase [Alligator mississippiensis]|uniref:Aminopeptidase n=2 Tax=Alligator mississippiensis TaxID=8496 RepID=A0A151MIP1_ALLMI|nr:glutamyl aminopeptidase [Alligator mississippiensis]
MDFESKKSKRYCMKKKHVIIICAVVAAVGLAVGLGVGLSRPEPCQSSGGTEKPAEKPTEKPAEKPTEKPAEKPTESPATSSPVQLGHCPPKNDQTGEWRHFRLPTYIIPEHYDLELKPEMDADTYTGTVNISIKLDDRTKYIWLHLRDIELTGMPTLRRSSLMPMLQSEIAVKQCFQYQPQEYLVIEAEEYLVPGDITTNYTLTLKFQGRLNGSLVGFYRTTYMESGTTKSIAATDHEPTDARKSFPCFDEPNKKATYNITIIHEDAYTALSNMPVEQRTPLGNGWTRTTFQKSVPMSTYLVCFAVHQFDYIEKISASGKPLRIYAQPQQIHTAEYAANVTKIVFDFFERYFNMNYSLPKLDKIAIPDFGTGAMENWGLITYRETNLLYDAKESASSNKQRVAAVIAHELVHQWFGNIVTMDWWDDLWLNEGFASFFEFLGVNAAEADWEMLDQVLIDDVLPVMKEDSLTTSHPIVVNVSSPAEITSVFDGISYSKGASILRMLQDWITPENFQKGCQEYLKAYHFKNAKTDDFWESLARASGQPVKEVMDTWTRQMGYPVLELYSNLTIRQKRFLLDPEAHPSEPPSALGYTWNIPVKWRAGNTTTLTFYNKSESSGITIKPSNPPANSFLKINTAHVGFYRVNYELQTWKDLANYLFKNYQSFSSADRAGVLDDAFSLARADIVNYSVPLDLTKYLQNETEYLPWQRVIVAVTYLSDMLKDDKDLYPIFQKNFQTLVKPITQQLGWNDEEDGPGTHVRRLLRASVLDFACSMGDQDALNNASKLFEEWINGRSLPVNLRLLVYRYGMQNSRNETHWNYMFQKYQTTPLAQEKEKLLYGLASVQNITLLDRYLKYIYNTNLIKSQDVFTLLRYISYNTYGKNMAWDWIRLNWEYLVGRYTINDRNLGRIVSITQTFNTEFQLWQMENFFEKYPNAGAGTAPRKQAIETVKSNIEWLTRNKKEIEAWLKP